MRVKEKVRGLLPGRKGLISRKRKTFAIAIVLPVALLGVAWSLWTAPVETPDAAAIGEAIERLPVVGSVLLTGAHPDDENNALLAYLARGMHLRVAYLSATRGDGGQNLLGLEQYEALGMLRTDELVEARKRDGAEQYFGQTYDFGFSKTAEETFEKWGKEDALGDFVRVVRSFRPDVLISRFTGTESDGHGHHQAAGILTREAFRAAADASRFPEHIAEGLTPWQASKLALNVFRAPAGSAGMISMPLDGLDPVFGKSYPQIGNEARVMHRSQGMGGGGGGRGASAAFRVWETAAPGGSADGNLFDGIDLTLNRFTTLSGGDREVAKSVEAVQSAIREATQMLSPLQPEKVIPSLALGLSELKKMREALVQSSAAKEAKTHALFLLDQKEKDFEHAIQLAAGLQMEAVADRELLVPGETIEVSVIAAIRAVEYLETQKIDLEAPIGWQVERQPVTNPLEAKFKVTIPANAAFSQPYWLVNERKKDYFAVNGVAWEGSAWNPPLLNVKANYMVKTDGNPLAITFPEEVIARIADRIYGQRELPLTTAPGVAVWIEPAEVVFPTGATKRTIRVRARNNYSVEQRGTVRLELPAQWTSNPASQAFSLAKSGDEISMRFEVTAPRATEGTTRSFQVKAIAEAANKNFDMGYQVIDYPHVQRRYWFQPAEATLSQMDVKIAQGMRVGYVMGTGDDVAEALVQLGVSVEKLESEDLETGDLSRFDAVVTGIRAYEVRQDLSRNHARMMDYVQNGGVMIVQYSRPQGFGPPLGPYKLEPGSGPRVTVEDTPVEILDAANPIFHAPNEITMKDFEGWVQERGTYFMESWAPEYKPLLASNDPGETPLKGGMLLAAHGKGYYLYTGYAWFRQLPAGVPGAYRLLANIVSLKKTAAR
ncbi:MAG: hypothetical protein A3F68_08415 [Acidobacteria bacterium RIFCSPLOWO2_12_FULL_54_10]|nr:MAG: hypothetical protein A3F68_08415 [Acidobacteria bacterium RIFCSPLOWO2_12_FULL_54_10]